MAKRAVRTQTPEVIPVDQPLLLDSQGLPKISPYVSMTYGMDGDTIVIELVIAIVGLGEKGDVLTVIQNPYIDNVLANGWAVIYSGPPVTGVPIYLFTNPQYLTPAQHICIQEMLVLCDDNTVPHYAAYH